MGGTELTGICRSRSSGVTRRVAVCWREPVTQTATIAKSKDKRDASTITPSRPIAAPDSSPTVAISSLAQISVNTTAEKITPISFRSSLESHSEWGLDVSQERWYQEDTITEICASRPNVMETRSTSLLETPLLSALQLDRSSRFRTVKDPSLAPISTIFALRNSPHALKTATPTDDALLRNNVTATRVILEQLVCNQDPEGSATHPNTMLSRLP